MKVFAAAVGRDSRRIAPRIEIGGEITGDKLAAFLESEGEVPGLSIVGEGRNRSYIDAPLHLRGWHVEVRDVSFIGPGAAPCGESAQLVLENPGAPNLTRVHFEPANGTWGLHVAATVRGRPDGTVRWQSRGYEATCARHSMGAYVDCSNHGAGGGMLFENQVSAKTEQRWRDEGDKGVWFNHAHIHRGHIAASPNRHDVRRWFLNQESEYIPLPAIEVRDCKIDVTDMHVDAYPSLGVIMGSVYGSEDKPRVRWHGPGGYVEPQIKEHGAGDWFAVAGENETTSQGWPLPYFDGKPPPVWHCYTPEGLIQLSDYPHEREWHISK